MGLDGTESTLSPFSSPLGMGMGIQFHEARVLYPCMKLGLCFQGEREEDGV